jgi:hypothetical protein
MFVHAGEQQKTQQTCTVWLKNNENLVNLLYPPSLQLLQVVTLKGNAMAATGGSVRVAAGCGSSDSIPTTKKDHQTLTVRMAATIIQWNCWGRRVNYNDLLLLLSSVEPVACCLQELLIYGYYTLGNRQYNLIATIPPQANNRPTGGAGILVHKAIPTAKQH